MLECAEEMMRGSNNVEIICFELVHFMFDHSGLLKVSFTEFPRPLSQQLQHIFIVEGELNTEDICLGLRQTSLLS